MVIEADRDKNLCLGHTSTPASLRLPVYRYGGLDTATNSDHTYSYTTIEWNTATLAVSPDSSFVEGQIPFTVPDSGLTPDLSTLFLDVKFVNTANLVEGDTWTILISSCGAGYPLTEGASATLTSEDGTAPVGQLTLDRGYEGTVPGSHEVYSVNQHFTVRASGEEGGRERGEGVSLPARRLWETITLKQSTQYLEQNGSVNTNGPCRVVVCNKLSYNISSCCRSRDEDLADFVYEPMLPAAM